MAFVVSSMSGDGLREGHVFMGPKAVLWAWDRDLGGCLAHSLCLSFPPPYHIRSTEDCSTSGTPLR